MFFRSAAACAMMIIALTLATAAQATTINTYSFTQDGYFSDTLPSGLTGVLTGSFSGTVPSNGIIGRADLTGFSYAFTIYNVDHTVFDSLLGGAADLAAFSYNPTGGASTLLISAQSDVGVCVGAAAAFGLCGGSGGYNGAFAFLNNGQPIVPGSGQPAFLVTSAAPQIALTAVATTPIPATLPLFGSALGSLGWFRWRKRRVQASATA